MSVVCHCLCVSLSGPKSSCPDYGRGHVRLWSHLSNCKKISLCSRLSILGKNYYLQRIQQECLRIVNSLLGPSEPDSPAQSLILTHLFGKR